MARTYDDGYEERHITKGVSVRDYGKTVSTCAKCKARWQGPGIQYKGKTYCPRCYQSIKIDSSPKFKCHKCHSQFPVSYKSMIGGSAYCSKCAAIKRHEMSIAAAKIRTIAIKAAQESALRTQQNAKNYDPDWAFKTGGDSVKYTKRHRKMKNTRNIRKRRI